jgi:integration host factor subunit alpha
VEKVSSRLDITRVEASDYVEAVISLVKETLEAGEKLKIAGFGVFEVKGKNARRGRNPQTGESITLEPRRVVTYKPSAILRDRINGSGE